MADGAVESVLTALGQFISLEVTLRTGLPGDIEKIADELKQISAFLKNAENRAEEDDSVKQWVTKVRVLAYDIEDALEEYQLLHKADTLSSFMQKLSFRERSLAQTIKLLLQRVAESRSYIATRSETNSVKQGSSETQVIRSSPVIQESELIAAQAPKRQLIERLSLQDVDLDREMIAVLGMRGLGKTTIVGSVYSDALVIDFFPTRAWISASETSSFTDMLRSMMKQFYEGDREIAKLQQANSRTSPGNNCLDPNTLNNIYCGQGTALHKLVREYLEHKRYMVVFDDVQEEHRQLADHVKRMLPANKGSKILMITRYEKMARAWLEGSAHGPYKLMPQTTENAWKLFCKMTFQNDNGNCPPGLIKLASEFVGRCEGLPLAILGIARVLSAKGPDQNEWEKVHANIGYYLQTNSHLTGIYKILNRDYHDLKDYLKPCFLYFGLFPKRYAINPMRLIRLWIAEGFVRKSACLTLEEVAEDYLNELINMCLVVVVSTDPTGKPKTLRVHDFVHEIILYKVDELSFCQILPSSVSTYIENPRRLSLHKDGDSADNVLKCINKINISKIRSLYLFDQVPEIFSRVLTKDIFNKVYLLKVLDLCNAPIDVLSDAIGSLLNLRYLSLRRTRVRKLPSSVGLLQDLQTLDLKHTNIHELPREICKLQKLRHLLAYFCRRDPNFSYHTMKVEGIKMPEGALGNFQELQKLAFVDVGRTDGCMNELLNLRQLRKLGITKLSKLADGKDICDAIEGMKHLLSLSVFTTYKNDTINILDCMKSPPPTLKYLYLSGCLMSLPKCILQLQSLLKVRLRWSNLEKNPLEILQKLPNLSELHLLEAYAGTEMHIEDGGFQKLKVLHLLDLYNLKSLVISKLALPLLEEMSIGGSPNLSMPNGIQHLSKLKTLNFYGMPESFRTDSQPGGPRDTIINHVHDVFFHVKRENGYWQTDKL